MLSSSFILYLNTDKSSVISLTACLVYSNDGMGTTHLWESKVKTRSMTFHCLASLMYPLLDLAYFLEPKLVLAPTVDVMKSVDAYWVRCAECQLLLACPTIQRLQTSEQALGR